MRGNRPCWHTPASTLQPSDTAPSNYQFVLNTCQNGLGSGNHPNPILPPFQKVGNERFPNEYPAPRTPHSTLDNCISGPRLHFALQFIEWLLLEPVCFLPRAGRRQPLSTAPCRASDKGTARPGQGKAPDPAPPARQCPEPPPPGGPLRPTSWGALVRIRKGYRTPFRRRILQAPSSIRDAPCSSLALNRETKGCWMKEHKGIDLKMVSRTLEESSQSGYRDLCLPALWHPLRNLEGSATDARIHRPARGSDQFSQSGDIQPAHLWARDARFGNQDALRRRPLPLWDPRHPKGWHRGLVRQFLDKEFKRQPSIASILRRDAPSFHVQSCPISCPHGMRQLLR